MYTVRVGFKVSEVRPNKLYEMTVERGADPHLTTGMALEHVASLVRAISGLIGPDGCAQSYGTQKHQCIKVSEPNISHGKQTVGIDIVHTEGCFETSEVLEAFIEKVGGLMNKAKATSQPAEKPRGSLTARAMV